MSDISWLAALALALIASVAPMVIGAFLLRNAVKDASDLASELPTRLVKEDTSEAREANRRKALRELVSLLVIRMAPGATLAISGVGLIFWIFCNLLKRGIHP
jgi:hypothetical protein